MASFEYHLKQAQIAGRLALAESDRASAARLHLLALEHFEKAEKMKPKSEAAMPPTPMANKTAATTPSTPPHLAAKPSTCHTIASTKITSIA
ncbi:hypothetical protein [Bradyrhizobium sp. AZCC 1721]|uniref:hypothetical protein n=1 Tax=Bradyrhizobium sp. AZCC 1721 TaxID=3117016 RepID=UPI002FF1F601